MKQIFLAFIFSASSLLILHPASGQTQFPGDVCSELRPDLCLNGVSASVTSLDTLRVGGNAGSELFRDKEEEGKSAMNSAFARHSYAGLNSSAEYAGREWTIWGGLNYSDFKSSVAVAPYEANLRNFMFGVDTFFSDDVLAGLSIGYESADTDTLFNGGGQDTSGFSFMPYVSWLLNDSWNIDAVAGYASLSTDQNRIDPASVPGSPLYLTSSFDSGRWFAMANLNTTQILDNWVFDGWTGFQYSTEDQDPYTEVGGPSIRSVRKRNVFLSQGYIGGDVARSIGAWEPYVLAEYRRDLSRNDGSGAGGLPSAVGATQPDDKDEVNLGLGIRYFGDQGLTGSLEWIRTTGRDQFKSDLYSFVIRYTM